MQTLNRLPFGYFRMFSVVKAKSISVFTMLLFCMSYSNAQVVLNEVATTNPNFYSDEDGDFPDWIELYNAGTSAVNLNGWGITDNSIWNRWQLPSVSLNTGERLLIFASGKNRNAFIPNSLTIDHWETALNDSDSWKYFIGVTNPNLNWNNVDSANAAWLNGIGGLGYGDGDDSTQVPAGTVSVYYEKYFTVTDQTQLINAILSMDYDDGFVAYINGVEVARSGITGTPDNTTPADADHEAVLYTGGIPESFLIDYNTLQSVLQNGLNKLSVEIHNVDAASSDLTGRTWLHFGISTTNSFYGNNPSWFVAPNVNSGVNLHTDFKITNGEKISLYNSNGVLQDSVTVNVQVGHSRARINDGGQWCYTNAPTPNAADTGECYTGYAAAPVVIPESGFFSGNVSVSMTGNNIHYTLDGTLPDTTLLPYTSAINITSTTAVNAQCFESGKLPSEVITKTYLVNEPTTLPVVSIIAVPRNLFNDGTGGPAVYDNAIWFQQTDKTFCTVQYFDANHQVQFTRDASVNVVGNYSIAFPQKSLQFVYDQNYGASGDVDYNIFSKDKPGLGSSHGFRVRNLDDDWSTSRLRDVVVNRMALNTYCGTAAYQNVVVFINGAYWGEYSAREILDQNFMRDNYGAVADSVDMIKAAYPIGAYVTEAGDDTSFTAMSDFLINNNLSDSSLYHDAINLIDNKNWVDYFAAEIYAGNLDWFPSWFFNNTRMASTPVVPWKYILWDVSYSQGIGGGASYDLLYNTLAAPTNPNKYTDMMNSLLVNPEFKNYFINRFADLMNYQWTNEKIFQIIDDAANEIAPEINAQAARWSSLDSVSWRAEVQNVKDYHTQRPPEMRNHIQSFFSLVGQVTVTLNVNPADAGYIKISTIIPDSLPWTGIYFDGNPVKITAIANPGYSFVDWDANTFIDSLTLNTFTNNISSNTSFTANFIGSPVTANIIFSELNYKNDSTLDAGDWVEIKNTTADTIDISDWKLENHYFYNQFIIPTGTVLAPGEYLVLANDTAKFHTQNPLVNNVIGNSGFNFSNNGDSILLFNNQSELIKSFSYSTQFPWRVTPDGYGRTLELSNDNANPNLPQSWFDGCMKGSPGVAYSPCDEELIPDEINYNSAAAHDAGDWIELQNNSSAAINISGFRVTDKNDNSFTIPSGTIILPDSFLVVYQDAVKFNIEFPWVANKVGPTVFGFSNSGDVIRIYDSNGTLNLSVCYDDTVPFPVEPNGQGYTLQLIHSNTNLNEGSNWQQSCFLGSPGVAFDPDCGAGNGIKILTNETVTVFPDPATDVLNISSAANRNYKIEIFNTMGKRMITTYHTAAINISSLAAGIYLIKIYDDHSVFERKFVKMN